MARYKAESLAGLAEGAAITTWKDVSGNGRDMTQATAGLKPLYSLGVNGHPEVACSYKHMAGEVQRYFVPAVGFNVPGECTLIHIGRPVSKELLGTYNVSVQTASAYFGYSAVGGACYFNNEAHDNARPVFHQTGMVGMTSSASALKVWTDGVAESYAASVPAPHAFARLGDGQGFLFIGGLNEVLIYDRALSDAEYGLVQTYARRKYGFSDTPTKQVIFDGDSLTTGYGSLNNRNFPQQLWGRLGRDWRYMNVAVAGQTTALMTAAAGARVDPYYAAGLAANVVVDWSGVLDLYYGRTPAQAAGDIAAYCAARQAAGWQVVCCTVLPAGFADNADREALNALIRANWATYADALADLDADVRIGGAAGNLNATYYNDSDGHKTHMTPAGFGVVAEVVKSAMDTL